MTPIQLPKFTLIEKLSASDTVCECSRCKREIKNSYLIKNNETGEVNNYGSGCAAKVMGITITEMVEQNKRYEEEISKARYEEDLKEEMRFNVQQFSEAEPAMLQFISEGAEENSFLNDMKTAIETKGALTEAQYSAVWRMMKPFANIEKGTKITEEVVYPIQMKIEEGFYGWSYTVIALNKSGEKVRIFFSSLNDQKEDALKRAEILIQDRSGRLQGITNIKLDNPIVVSGTHDGYKIKRAKISLFSEEKVV